ncbi:MAG: conjugal transfer protein TraF [Deltaproteobacteria bacterium]|nr:conjugal transfer protein TraF [Deltaproteobacteria bacterium]MDE0355866.1 conjugal transfer protein TraF [Deltaproteobacteria bacterium]
MSSVSALSLVCFLGILAALPADAREWRPWCGPPQGMDGDASPSLGWHFYCDRDEGDAEADETRAPKQPPAQPESPMERIRERRRALEEARAKAVLDPNPGNVAAYLRLQQEVLQRAASFSDAFRRTVWGSPDLDYMLRRPVGALAKRLWSDERRAERTAVLARLGERYGLIYLGDANCPACRVFGPLLRAFVLRYKLDVLAVSMTGEPLEGWPEAVPDQGRAARLGLTTRVVPAVFLYDTRTSRALPVSFGVVAEDQLAERIFALTSREVGSDY